MCRRDSRDETEEQFFERSIKKKKKRLRSEMLSFFTTKRKRILSHKVIPNIAGGLCVLRAADLKKIMLY